MASWPAIYRIFGPTVPKSAFRVFGPNQKDALRKVMQIRGGITSGSAFFGLFTAVEDFHVQSFLQVPTFCLFQIREFSVH